MEVVMMEKLLQQQLDLKTLAHSKKTVSSNSALAESLLSSSILSSNNSVQNCSTSNNNNNNNKYSCSPMPSQMCTLSELTAKSLSAPSSPTDDSDSERNYGRCEPCSYPKSAAQQQQQMQRKRLQNSSSRRVQFPADDNIVTGYCDLPEPWTTEDPGQLTPEKMLDVYRKACKKQFIDPLKKLEDQIKEITVFDSRTHTLNLSGETLDPRQCEALEEILKRVQFRSINLESCNLNDEGSTALFDMFEYYESTSHLNISGNKDIDMRGWQTCSRMLKKATFLKHLELGSNGLNEQVLLVLGRALRLGSGLVTLNLANSSIYCRTLAILVAALKLNSTLGRLDLSNNKISAKDSIQIGNLLKVNCNLKYIDLSNNNLEDAGLETIIESLSMQPKGCGLETLILNCNLITSRGMYSMATLLPFCSSIRGISLDSNDIGDEGISALKETLQSAQLTFLGLRNTRLTSGGIQSLSEIISHTTNLRVIDCRENSLQECDLTALADALKHNSSVVKLLFDRLSVEESDIEKLNSLYEDIAAVCDKNKSALSFEEEEYLKDLEWHVPEAKEDFKLAQDIPLAEQPIEKEFKAVNSSAPQSRFKVKIVKNISDSCLLQSSSTSNNTTSAFNDDEVSPQPKFVRSASVGSWYLQNPRNGCSSSGRFSVSPVPDAEVGVLPLNGTKSSASDNGMSEKPPQLPSRINGENGVAHGVKNEEEFKEESKDTIVPELHEKSSSEPLKVRKKTSFVLPEGHSDAIKGTNNNKDYANVNRRMSTPNMPSSPAIAIPRPRPKIPSLKTLTTLDSLDLKSSVPLSPTRLSSCFDMPDPMTLRLPVEVLEYLERLQLHD
ncbi:Protein phosphatase 1 regulatory subunit 37 [Halotydeus destructor]|nr:Protein phosphatase 1 regulatory subunit 37 [Halotydeus destructor]